MQMLYLLLITHGTDILGQIGNFVQSWIIALCLNDADDDEFAEGLSGSFARMKTLLAAFSFTLNISQSN